MRIADHMQVVAGFGPVDMTSGNNLGDWICMKNFAHLTAILFKAAGTANDDPIFKLQQATNVAGAGAKDLLFGEIFVKAGTLTAIGQFTRVTQVPATQYQDLTHAEIAAIYMVEIEAEQLDSDGGFDCIQVSVADVGAAAQLGGCLYILSEARYTPPPSAIVD